MYPWGHAAFAYVCLLCLAVLTHRRLSRTQLLSALVASQVPDLVDKPLAWQLGFLPSGRSLGHSLLFAVPLVVGITVVAARRSRLEVAVAFAVGYASHLLGDTYVEIFYWRVDEFAYLLWPVGAPYPYDTPIDILALVGSVDLALALVVKSVVGLAGCAVFAAHFLYAPWWRRDTTA